MSTWTPGTVPTPGRTRSHSASPSRDFADALPVVLRSPEVGHDIVLGDPDGAPVVAGPAYAVAAWLIGRSPGTGLTVTPSGPLPPVPPWR